jgi:hypothetical protein
VPLTRGTTDLSISDRPATPFHRPDPPSPTQDEANPNPNGLGFGSPLRISPLGNQVIRRVIRLPTSIRTRSATRAPSPMRVHRTRRCGESGSASRNMEMGWGYGGENGGPLTGVAWVVVNGLMVGVLTRRRPGHMVGLDLQERRRQRGGETEDWLGHRCKHGGRTSVC